MQVLFDPLGPAGASRNRNLPPRLRPAPPCLPQKGNQFSEFLETLDALLHQLRVRQRRREVVGRQGVVDALLGQGVHERYPLAKPIHHRNWHRVAHCFIAKGVRALVRWLTSVRDSRVVVRQSLEPFRLDREYVSGDSIGYHRVAVAFVTQYINSSRTAIP